MDIYEDVVNTDYVVWGKSRVLCSMNKNNYIQVWKKIVSTLIYGAKYAKKFKCIEILKMRPAEM